MLLCRKLDLFGRELVAVDGTRLKAVNSTDRNFTREKLKKLIQWADERLAVYLACLDRTDGEEGTASSVPAKNLAEKYCHSETAPWPVRRAVAGTGTHRREARFR